MQQRVELTYNFSATTAAGGACGRGLRWPSAPALRSMAGPAATPTMPVTGPPPDTGATCMGGQGSFAGLACSISISIWQHGDATPLPCCCHHAYLIWTLAASFGARPWAWAPWDPRAARCGAPGVMAPSSTAAIWPVMVDCACNGVEAARLLGAIRANCACCSPHAPAASMPATTSAKGCSEGALRPRCLRATAAHAERWRELVRSGRLCQHRRSPKGRSQSQRWPRKHSLEFSLHA